MSNRSSRAVLPWQQIETARQIARASRNAFRSAAAETPLWHSRSRGSSESGGVATALQNRRCAPVAVNRESASTRWSLLGRACVSAAVVTRQQIEVYRLTAITGG